MPRTYKVRSFVNGRSKAGQPFVNYSLTIPTDIARHLPDDVAFTCEVTDEGVLYRPALAPAAPALPVWATR